ncbi:phosphotransferase enzyme family protein [Mucilaginibacter sp. BT774]|uniref:phosphotransferase enzyme family protein n=1 Tax=Mucilaginibacter sp. BT774 TaxID=3062276 RepID=UPI002674CA7B|nr:aminoglycoside phosphotransferase family protein [Mucilaginibacter sp. BT774]MDO3628357.1 aminoglycoside phosphotransferase family protein [Mucilaginibacter sp. BT774]
MGLDNNKYEGIDMHDKISTYNFKDIIANFNIAPGDYDIEPFGSGHINDTFLLTIGSGYDGAYLLQKINHFVFKNVDGLMTNMLHVINHLKGKAGTSGDPAKEILTLVPCKDNKYYWQDDQGNYWRMTYFLKDTQSYDLVTTVKQAYQGGAAFGNFHWLLCDLDPALLVDTIPDFLNIEKRLDNLQRAIEKDSVGVVKQVQPELLYLLEYASSMGEISQLGRAGILPLRITHNDTKFNNILLNQYDEVQCVIDLDTVMPGFVAYDFGDAIRSIINTAAEDEKNLDAIQLNMPLFEAFVKGYLSKTVCFLTEQELKSLVKGALLLPYMQAVRFLTDYLEGDVYYKTHFPGHNLQRARAQMQLFKMLESKKDELTNIVQQQWLLIKNDLKALNA